MEPKETVTEFWMVYRKDGDKMPKVHHALEADALAEATRLANNHPGKLFVVLHAVAALKAAVNPAGIVPIAPYDEIPF